MKWFVIVKNPYFKHGPFSSQVAAEAFGKSLNGREYKITCKDF